MLEFEIERMREVLFQHGYDYLKFLGSGSFSCVAICKSKKYNQQFAVKQAIKHKISVDEYNTLVSLHHPNIIQLYDAFEDEDSQYLVMDYCSNGTMRDKTNLPYEYFLYYAKQILEALAFCHSHNIAHRDIKPENIFLDQYDHVKLADFGLARQFDEENKSKEKCGSLIFIAPEVLQYNEVCPFKADIWALGITFFYLATGTYPFKTKSRELLKKAIIAGELDYSQCKIDPKIRFIISKMCTKNPNSRFTAQQILKLPMFSPVLTKKPTFLNDLSRKKSFTTGYLGAKAQINKSMTFDSTQSGFGSDGEDKPKIPAIDILSYRSINIKPNIQRMSSRGQLPSSRPL